MEKETIIDKYISGSLSQVEQLKFDQWMKEDKAFREEVAFYENLSAVAQDHEKVELKERVETLESQLGGGKKRTLLRIIFIVVGLVLLTISYFGLKKDKVTEGPVDLYASHYEVYPNVYHPVTRGNSDEMTKAFMAYESGRYSEAAELLEEQIDSSNTSALKFYQAMAYGETGQFALAIKNLEEVRRMDSPYLEQSFWYLGLYYLKEGNKAASAARLEQFIEISEDEAKKEKAREIVGAAGD